MPRAPQYGIIGQEEMDYARGFVSKGLVSALGVTTKADGSGLLLNEATNSSYAIVPTVLHEGRLAFALRCPTAVPNFVAGEPMWLGILDPYKSELHIIHRATFLNEIQKSLATAHAGLLVEQKEGWWICKLHIEWANSAKLIRKTAKLKVDGDPYMLSRDVAMATDDQFVHLHNHSHYSMLDGTMTPDQMVERIVRNGQKAVALTDHGVMFGCWKMYKACKDWGVKPILGCEVYLVDDVQNRYKDADGKDRRFEYHQTLIAMNAEGWQNLCELVSEAFRDHYYYVPRISHQMLFQKNAGIICLTGCFKGMAAWHLQQFKQPEDGSQLPYWYRRDPDHVRRVLMDYKQVFGDRLYGELHSNDFDRYMQIMPELAQMHRDCGIPSLVAGDVHYEQAEDAIFQAMMTKISSNKVDEIGDKFKAGPYYLKARDEIDPVGVLTPDMFSRTVEVADRCTLDFPKGFLFPTYQHQQDCDWQAYLASKGQA